MSKDGLREEPLREEKVAEERASPRREKLREEKNSKEKATKTEVLPSHLISLRVNWGPISNRLHDVQGGNQARSRWLMLT